jgi:hypothetical protein
MPTPAVSRDAFDLVGEVEDVGDGVEHSDLRQAPLMP